MGFLAALPGAAIVAIGAASSGELPVWAYLAGIIGPAILGVRWWTGRMEKRLMEAQGTTELATAELTEAKTEEIKEHLRLSVLESVQADMARQREETARAQAAEKEALAEVAILIAQHARDRAEWKDERHALINENRALRNEVDLLRKEVHTLRIELGLAQGRRVDDRLGSLEKDMVREQYRNTEIEQRADVAHERADVAEARADEQEARRDEDHP